MALFIQEKDLLFVSRAFCIVIIRIGFRFQDSFIEDIESILNSGTVVDLFEPDEFNALAMDLKNEAYISNMSDTPGQLREFFYQVISIHVVQQRLIIVSIFVSSVFERIYM